MSTYIPRQIKQTRERLEAKVDRDLIVKLDLYCRYLESDRDYVLACALEIAFRRDKGFAEWLKSQPGDPAALAHPRRGRRPPEAESPASATQQTSRMLTEPVREV